MHYSSPSLSKKSGNRSIVNHYGHSSATDLKSASKDTNHEHDYRQIVGEHVPPRLQDSERWLLLRELPEFHHRNHDACYNKNGKLVHMSLDQYNERNCLTIKG